MGTSEDGSVPDWLRSSEDEIERWHAFIAETRELKRNRITTDPGSK